MARIAVLEYLSGGGLEGCNSGQLNDANISNELRSLYDEGVGMLSALCEDLVACGHRVITVLDSQIPLPSSGWLAEQLIQENLDSELGRSPRAAIEAIWTTTVDPYFDCWLQAASQADKTIVIAPETNDILSDLIKRLRSKGIEVLAGSESFLALASHKLAMTDYWNCKSKKGSAQSPNVVQPPTVRGSDWSRGCFDLDDNRIRLSSFANWPYSGWVTKREDGAGCSDMFWHQDVDALENWLEVSTHSICIDSILVQPWLVGIHASSSLVVTSDPACRTMQRIQWVGAMRQDIRQSNTVEYRGGIGPLSDHDADVISSWSRKLLDSLPGVCGWVGIDFLLPTKMEVNQLTEQDIIFIEINPRLTSSYLGYRKQYGARLADSIIGITGSLISIDGFSPDSLQFSVKQ